MTYEHDTHIEYTDLTTYAVGEIQRAIEHHMLRDALNSLSGDMLCEIVNVIERTLNCAVRH